MVTATTPVTCISIFLFTDMTLRDKPPMCVVFVVSTFLAFV